MHKHIYICMYVCNSICITTFVYQHLCFFFRSGFDPASRAAGLGTPRHQCCSKKAATSPETFGKSWESHGNCGKLWEGMEDKMWKICKPIKICMEI